MGQIDVFAEIGCFEQLLQQDDLCTPGGRPARARLAARSQLQAIWVTATVIVLIAPAL